MLSKNICLTIIIIFISILIVYVFISNRCTEEDSQRKLNELKNVCKENIAELSIVSNRSDKLFYMRITNIKILDEFKRTIIQETFDPKQQIGQFEDRDIISIKYNNEQLYSIKILTLPFDKNFIKPDTADIIFFSNSNVFNVYDVMDNNVYDWDDSFSYNIFSKYGGRAPCYQFRNYSLYNFIEKYINTTIQQNGKNKYGIYFEARKENP